MNKFINRCTFLAISAAAIYFTAFAVIFLWASFLPQEDLSITNAVCLGLGILFAVLAIPCWVFFLIAIFRKPIQ